MEQFSTTGQSQDSVSVGVDLFWQLFFSMGIILWAVASQGWSISCLSMQFYDPVDKVSNHFIKLSKLVVQQSLTCVWTRKAYCTTPQRCLVNPGGSGVLTTSPLFPWLRTWNGYIALPNSCPSGTILFLLLSALTTITDATDNKWLRLRPPWLRKILKTLLTST